MHTASLHALSAAAMGAAYRTRTLSPVQVTAAVNDRIAQLQPQWGTLWQCKAERALALACASEARWRAGQPLGPLDGIPLILKSRFAAGRHAYPTAASGMQATPHHPSALVQSLLEAGAVFVGEGDGDSADDGDHDGAVHSSRLLGADLCAIHALTHTPWHALGKPSAEATPGCGPLHVGLDVAGSLRLLAAWSGLFAFKPSAGAAALSASDMAPCAGPMTRTVEDATLLLAAIGQAQGAKHSGTPAIEGSTFDVAPSFLIGKRVGVLLDAGCGLPVHASVRTAVQLAAQQLAAAGARVSLMTPFMNHAMLEGMDHFWRMRHWREIQALSRAQHQRLAPALLTWAQSAAHFSAEHVIDAYGQFAATRDAALAATAAYDFVISPVAPQLPARLPMGSDSLRPLEHLGFTVPYSMSAQPAAAIACASSDDLRPIGLQVCGPRGGDVGVLRFCRALEQLRPAAASSTAVH